MIRVNALVFLFIIQFLLMFLGLSIFLFIRHRKLSVKATIAQGEIRRLESEMTGQQQEITNLLPLQDMIKGLQQKFEESKTLNTQMKEMIDFLVPEAERTKEFQQLLTEMEQSNKDLDTSLGTLQMENASLHEQMKSSRKEVDKLSTKLRDTVKKDEYQNVLSEKKGLELKVESLQTRLEEKTKELEKLEKNYIYLEKEYNALYKNFKGEEP
ncbi:MAG: hypothetical protein HZB61_04915 [Nitrospirae bacterium]|nr:hypothetical protein [Nitrospirota bacterium]